MDFILACLPWWGLFMAVIVIFTLVLVLIQRKRDNELKRKWIAERAEAEKSNGGDSDVH